MAKVLGWAWGAVCIGMFVFLIVGIAILVLNALAVLGGVSGAALSAVGLY